MKFKQKYQNGLEVEYTMVSIMVDELEDSAVILTQENGYMVISKNDHPDIWKEVVKDNKYKAAKIQADIRKPARLAEIEAEKLSR